MRINSKPYYLNWDDELGLVIKRDEDYDFEAQLIARILTQEEDYSLDVLLALTAEMKNNPSKENFLAQVNELASLSPLSPRACTQESVRYSKTPAYLHIAIHSPRKAVLAQVAKKPNLPLKMAIKLAKINHGAIHLALARNPTTHPKALDELTDKRREILMALATNPNLAPASMLKLLDNPYFDLSCCSLLMRNPAHTRELFETIINGTNDRFKERALASHHVDKPSLKILLSDNNKNVRAESIKHILCSQNQLLAATQDTSEFVRREILDNPHLDVALVKILLEDSAPSVRRGAAASNLITPELIDSLLDKPDGTRDYVFAGKENLSPGAMEVYARRPGDTGTYCRIGLAGNKKLPLELLTILSCDASPSVRSAVCRNKNIPDSVLRQLYKDRDKEVRNSASRALKMRALRKQTGGFTL